jgi:hypothetical protein
MTGEPWSVLRLCDFCGSDAVALAPQTNHQGSDLAYHLICGDCLLGWWDHDMPPEKRLPVFLLPSAPRKFAEHPVYDTEPVHRGWWERFFRTWI